MEYIKFDGKQMPFNLGTQAIKEAEALSGVNCVMIKDFTLTLCSIFLYVGLKNGARRAEEEFKWTMADIENKMDDYENKAELLGIVAKEYAKQVLHVSDGSNIEQPGERKLKAG